MSILKRKSGGKETNPVPVMTILDRLEMKRHTIATQSKVDQKKLWAKMRVMDRAG